MNQIKKTIWYIFTSENNKFSFIFVLLWFPYQHYRFTKDFNVTKEFSSTIILIYLISFVFSYLVVTGLSELKKTYIWKINSEYRHKLLSSVLIIALIFSIVFAQIYSNNVLMFLMYFLIAFGVFCYNSFKSGKEPVYINLLAFSFPLILFLSNKLNQDQNIIIILTFNHALLLIFIGYRYYKKLKSVSSTDTELDQFDDDITLCNSEANYKVGQFFKTVNPFSKAKIDLLISSPIKKYGITGALYVALVVFIVYLTNTNNTELVATIVLVVMFVSITIASRKLMLQTSKISHVFTGGDHKKLKNKILFALDKTLAVNCLVYVVITGLILNAIGSSTNTEFLLISTIVIVLLGLAYYPIIIVFEEIPIFRIFPPLFFVIISAAIVFGASQNKEQHLSIEYIAGYILACLILRWFSQNLFLNTPYENLIKQNY